MYYAAPLLHTYLGHKAKTVVYCAMSFAHLYQHLPVTIGIQLNDGRRLSTSISNHVNQLIYLCNNLCALINWSSR